MAISSRSNDSVAARFAAGLATYVTGSDLIELNDGDYAPTSIDGSGLYLNSNNGTQYLALWLFFPERREVTAFAVGFGETTMADDQYVSAVHGSNDTTNGVDGTWETASLGGSSHAASLDGWRRHIPTISFTGAKRVIRIGFAGPSTPGCYIRLVHIYGRKTAGQTPDDIIFIDHDTTPGAEYTAPEDFGDRPLGTTVTRQFRVKNASATKTANTINLQVNDADFTISTDGTTWVVTINLASLAAGAESATMYVRNTTPAPGNLLGPRFAEIVAGVGSWS